MVVIKKIELKLSWKFFKLFGEKRSYRDGISARNTIFREAIPVETGFIVGIKMNSVEFENEGLSVEEAAWMCQQFEVTFIYPITSTNIFYFRE